MMFELLCFRITVNGWLRKDRSVRRNVVQTQTADRQFVFGCSFCTGWPYSPHPNECVRSSPLTAPGANWIRSTAPETGLGWWQSPPLKLQSGSSGGTYAWAKRKTPRCAQFWTEELLRRWRYFGFKGHTVYFLINSFECEWFKLVWPNWSSEAKKSFSYLTQRLTHRLRPLTPPVTRFCGYDPLAVSPHFCAASF